MTSLRKILVFLLISIQGIVAAQSGFYPPPSSVVFHNDTLTIYPPDSLPGEPVLLLGYNIYVDSIFFDNILDINPEDTIDFLFEIPGILPGSHEFCAKAFYNEWISDAACDTGQVIYGFELPFLEDWSSGNFEENLWVSTSGNWVVENDDGNPAPAVEFKGDPAQTNYELWIESYPLNALGLTTGRIWLDFDLKLNAIQSTDNEKLEVQVWNWKTKTWKTYALFSNEEGSFDWNPQHISIGLARNNLYILRFLATGVNSSDIQGWLIDNIHIYRKCDGPSELDIYEHAEFNELQWDGPDIGFIDEWIHWDDGVNAGNSIGTGGAVEFDVAARWSSAQLVQFQGTSISEIAFFPAEEAATYRVRVWTGSGPDTLIADQLITSPLIGQWNYTIFTTPLLLDITKDLWVGYHVNTSAGYPAGVDDGPGIDGYGNMMYFEDKWQTLLQINAELDFNWNIACHLIGTGYNGTTLAYKLYREKNNEGLQFYNLIDDNTEFVDSNIVLSDFYCYELTAIWYKDGDTCESAPTNTACEYLMLGTGQQENEKNIRLYPNPATNILNIETEEAIREVRIYNPLGEMVLKMEIGNSEARVDVRGLENGIYFVEILAEKNRIRQKVFIIR